MSWQYSISETAKTDQMNLDGNVGPSEADSNIVLVQQIFDHWKQLDSVSVKTDCPKWKSG